MADTQKDVTDDAGAEDEVADLDDDTSTDEATDTQEDLTDGAGTEDEAADLDDDTSTDEATDTQEDLADGAGTEDEAADLDDDTSADDATDTQQDMNDDADTDNETTDLDDEASTDDATDNQKDMNGGAGTENEAADLDDDTVGVSTHSSSVDIAPETENSQDAFRQLSDYMNKHNYGKGDYDTYSKDPKWQRLHSNAFPNSNLTETTGADTQEDAFRQLSDYMNKHNYGRGDYSTYSKDPEWQRLHSVAFPDSHVETPELEIIQPTDTSTLDFNEMSDEEKLSALEQQCRNDDLVRTVDFHDFDPDVAMSMTNALADAKKDFPDLDVSYVGSIDSQVRGIHDTVAQSYENELRQLNGDAFSDEEYRAAAQKYADNYINRVGLNDSDNAFAWSLNIPSEYDPTGDGLAEYNGIAVNNRFAGDNKLFTESKINEVATKHKPIGCDTPRATADHELGHEIDKLLNASSDKQINDMYNKMLSEGNAQNTLSTYSATNVKEFIAEAYSEYRNNPSPRAYSTAVYNRLIELRNMKGGIRL